ncbi:MAG TPA: GNAT family N-acetyltransferase [Jatrophihabitans sp.]|uniref:GNAT family N-acetyltransferase n=1 Tax=Jatrophihabitans sp. TaxID=1932789 RepID=UPI002EF8035E
MSGYSTPRPIGSEDDLADFDSGEPSLDEWLRKRSVINQATGASRCFVTCRDGRVVGYYALATGSVQRLAATPRVGQGMPEPIPVVLLGRLAVDLKEQGRRLGSQLLRDAIARTVAAAEIVGIRALLVHALHERAREFYLHYDFEQSPTDPLHLMLLMKDARKIVGRPG